MSGTAKRRLDRYLAEAGLVESREKAKALVIAGQVRVDGATVTQPSHMVSDAQQVEVEKPSPYVSRGGFKLEKAIAEFGLDLTGKVCADIGASTGGFTDCMLQNGAVRVHAVDVGYGQLAWKLRNDPRVRVLERTNARYLEDLGEPAQFASIDVAFISLSLVLPAVMRILADDGQVVALIKPQFEAGRDKVGKKGVVRDEAVHRQVMERVLEDAEKLGMHAHALSYSPIKGPNGNIEYLVLLSKRGPGEVTRQRIAEVAREAHERLDNQEAREQT